MKGMDFLDEPWDTSMSTVLTQKYLEENNSYCNSAFFKDSFNISNKKTNEEQSDTFFELPMNVKHMIQKYKGINNLYDWQTDCLQLEAVRKRQNLVYSLPTSGGKTLVAEILMLRELLVNEQNVIFVLPYVALAQEKVRSLSPFGLDLGFYVEEYVGGKGIYPPVKHKKKRSVYVCTIEKGSGLIDSLIQNDRLKSEIGMLVVDEVHLVGDKSRGTVLETLLTKLMYIGSSVHIIAMSATIGNLDEVAKFLKAYIYTQDFRPVELSEYVKCDENIFRVVRNADGYSTLKLERKMDIKYPSEMLKLDPSCLGILVQEVIPKESCLVFCSTKNGCCNFAVLICKTIANGSAKDFKKDEKMSLLRALKEEGQGDICPILKKTIPYGVAYHHSGLTNAERKLLEEAFLSGTICCICCTSTLAAGVNLPAKRVIILSPYVGRDFLRLSSYKQMSGRAGRMGYTDEGQSILVCQKSEISKVSELLESTMDFCESNLNNTGFSSLIVTAIGLGLAKTKGDLKTLFTHSLLHVQTTGRREDVEIELLVDTYIEDLLNSKALLENNETKEYILTPLANASMAGNLNIEEGQLLYNDLEEAVSEGLILKNYLHLFYLITPYSMLEEIPLSRDVVISVYSNLSPIETKIAFRLGITEACLCQYFKTGTVKIVQERIWKRFLLSLVIFELWNSNSLWKVSKKFDISRGLIHSFLMRTAAFASSVQRFTEALKMEQFECFPPLLQKIIPRIAHCCTIELLQLMQLPAVKIGRAQQLYKAGYRTLNDIANVDPQLLVSQIDHLPRKVAYEIVAAAKLLMLQKAETLQEEADSIKAELNVNPDKSITSTSTLFTKAEHYENVVRTSTPLADISTIPTRLRKNEGSFHLSSNKKLRI